MDKFKKLNGSVKASLTVLMVLALAGTLALLAAEKEKSERGFLGVSVQRLDSVKREKLGVTHGVLVVDVEKESAAAKAGILEDDVILSVNGEKIRETQSLTELIRELAPGSAVKIGLWRDGKAHGGQSGPGQVRAPQALAPGTASRRPRSSVPRPSWG